MELPFECPVDHVFDAAALEKSGLRFRFRKFMRHPRVTLGPLMKSLKTVALCGAGPGRTPTLPGGARGV